MTIPSIIIIVVLILWACWVARMYLVARAARAEAERVQAIPPALRG